MTSRLGSPEKWDRAGWVFLLIFAATDFVSISAAQMAAAGLVICWMGRWFSSGQKPDFSALKWPIALFAVMSAVSALASYDVMESVRDSKDLFHFFIFFAAYDYLSRHPERIITAVKVAVGGGAVAAVHGLGQAVVRGVEINNRISGFQSIYMTFAGLLMLGAVSALAVALFGRQGKSAGWLYAATALMTAAIAVSLTRNAMVGLFVGAFLLLALRSPWAGASAPIVAAIAIALAPSHIQERVLSVANTQNETNKERLYLWSAGIRIARDHPFFGVGQNSFPLVYPKYRHPDVKEPNISHLHNNVIEIAAERGGAGLLAWLSIWAVALWKTVSAWRRMGAGHIRAAAAMGMSTIAAFLVAGMFEYNFGAAVMQMLIYFFVAASLAAEKRSQTAPIGA
ncbi:MAG: O-antigen ligase family protein [Nitrospinae bacterium]|nr:O-antigen ligase family protein [Nitrospinota bacterium]MBF0634453.1 O-antigen ligase family protein [Nitrospinota bacterium]